MRLRSWRAASAAVVLGVFALIACGESDEPIEESNDVYSVTIPAGYDEASGVTQGVVEEQAEQKLGEDLGGEVSLDLSNVWTKEPEDGFATNINVATESVGTAMTLERYSEISIENAAPVGATVEGEPEETTLGGEPARAFEVTQSVQDLEARSRIVTVVRDGLAYSVTLTALDERFDDEVEDFEEALQSWTWRD